MAEQLLNYGALGVFVVLFISGLVAPKTVVDRLIAERDRAEAHRDSVVADVLEKVAPALERAVEAVKARESYESEIREVLVDLRRLLEQGR